MLWLFRLFCVFACTLRICVILRKNAIGILMGFFIETYHFGKRRHEQYHFQSLHTVVSPPLDGFSFFHQCYGIFSAEVFHSLAKFILFTFHDIFFFFVHQLSRIYRKILNFVDFLFWNFVEYIHFFLWNLRFFFQGKYIILKPIYLLPLFLFVCLFFHFA